MPTIIDVAKHAGVSASTAKRAIREPQLLAPETLERVLKAIEELEYEPNHAAGALRRGHNLTVGLMVGDIMANFFATLTRTIGQEVRAQGYTLLMAENEYREDIELANLKMLHGQRLGGLIIRSAYGRGNYDYLRRMQRQNTAIVEIDYFHVGSPFHHVMLDGHAAVTEGVRYLHALGHERIAALTLQEAADYPDERTDVFVQVMRDIGLPLPDAYNPKVRKPKEATNQDYVYNLTSTLMRLPEPPTALFSLTGVTGSSVYRALRDLKLRIPEDVSFLTIDNDPWTQVTSPPIDALEQPVQRMALAAARLVLSESQSPSQSVVQQRFSATLLRRGSCSAPKAIAKV